MKSGTYTESPHVGDLATAPTYFSIKLQICEQKKLEMFPVPVFELPSRCQVIQREAAAPKSCPNCGYLSKRNIVVIYTTTFWNDCLHNHTEGENGRSQTFRSHL